MSKSSGLVSWDGHVTWLRSRIALEHPHLYLVELDGRSIGTFRIDGDYLSYTIAPSHRGQGYGSEMLRLIRKNFGIKRAEIFLRNIASIKVAKSAGHEVIIIDHENPASPA